MLALFATLAFTSSQAFAEENDSADLQASTSYNVMYRLYNKYTGEHFYTASSTEKSNLVKVGWNDEGTGWYAPKSSNTPVYRLYNKYVTGGDHHYTTSTSERDTLKKAGWSDEGTGWYSDDSKSVPLYRQYNPYAQTGTHNYTAFESEKNEVVKAGWKDESVGWYGLSGCTSETEVAFAVFSQEDQSLNFYKRKTIPFTGSTFEGRIVKNVYLNVENTDTYSNTPEWTPSSISSASPDKTVKSVSFVDKISPNCTAKWFWGMQGLGSINNVSNLDTNKVSDMSYMFYYCTALKSLDLSSLSSQNVNSFRCTFEGCTSLESLNVSELNTSSATSMYAMFGNCKSLKTVDVSGFDTSKVTEMYAMFSGCASLQTLDVSNFNTSNVTRMRTMFESCSSLKTLDVSGFDTGKVTDMFGMFQYCSSLKCDCSKWNVAKVTSHDRFRENASGVTAPNWIK